MSCAGKGYGTNPQSNAYLTAQFNSSYLISSLGSQTVDVSDPQKTSRKCRKYQGFYPSFTPILGSLSVTSSASGNYSLVYIDGSNFLPNGTTFVKFGGWADCPVTFYSSFNISFVVPQGAPSGSYDVQVVNIYNGNFSPQINQSYAGNLNYSNSITYMIT